LDCNGAHHRISAANPLALKTGGIKNPEKPTNGRLWDLDCNGAHHRISAANPLALKTGGIKNHVSRPTEGCGIWIAMVPITGSAQPNRSKPQPNTGIKNVGILYFS
jgi:hypothetical protein